MLPTTELGAAALPARSGGWRRGLLHLAILAPLALGMCLFQLGAADWEDDSESCGGQIVQEMVGGCGWILPLRNARHIPVKPPLFYWLGAASAKLRGTGGDLLDARLPSAVLGAWCVVCVYLLARRLAGDAVALWAGLILTTTPQFVIEARNSRVDIALCAFLTPALFLAWRVWDGEGDRRTALGAALCVALAMLSKGPLAFGLMVLVLLAAVPVVRPAPTWRALLAPATLAVALGIPALWYAAATLQHGLPFLQLHIYSENVSRLLGQQGRYAVLFYLEPLVTSGLPWILALPLAAVGESRLPSRSRRFLWVWVITMLVFFSLSPGKRRAYLLPLRPALAILLAGWLVPQLGRLREYARESSVPRAAHLAIGAFVLLGMAAIVALRAGIGGFGTDEMEWSHWWRDYFRNHLATALALPLGLGIGVDLLVRWIVQRRWELAAYALAGTVAWGLTIGIAAGAIVRGAGASFQSFAAQVAAQVPPSAPLAFFDLDDEQEIAFLFHLHRHVPVISPVDPLAPCTPPTGGLYLVLESRWNKDACFRSEAWQELARGGPQAESQHWWRLVLARYAPSDQPMPE